LHIGQYAGSVSSDRSQGQVLVDPLGSPAMSTTFCEATKKRGGGLAIHTNGLNCNWLKMQQKPP